MTWRRIMSCLGALALAACTSPGTEKSMGELLGEQFVGERAEFTQRFIQLIRTQAPALQVVFIDKEASSTFLRESRTGSFETYLSPDGASLTFDRGMLHSTRGFGAGLLASDLSEPLALVLTGREGFSDRLMTYLDGNDYAVTRTFRCKVTDQGPSSVMLTTGRVPALLMSEACRSLDQSFTNYYWVGIQSGRILQTRQWVGASVGEISTRVVPE